MGESHDHEATLNQLLAAISAYQVHRVQGGNQAFNLQDQWHYLLKARVYTQHDLSYVKDNHLNSRNLLQNGQVVGGNYRNLVAPQSCIGSLGWELPKRNHFLPLAVVDDPQQFLKLVIPFLSIVFLIDEGDKLLGLFFPSLFQQILSSLIRVIINQVVDLNPQEHIRQQIHHSPILPSLQHHRNQIGKRKSRNESNSKEDLIDDAEFGSEFQRDKLFDIGGSQNSTDAYCESLYESAEEQERQYFSLQQEGDHNRQHSHPYEALS